MIVFNLCARAEKLAEEILKEVEKRQESKKTK